MERQSYGREFGSSSSIEILPSMDGDDGSYKDGRLIGVA